MNVITLACETQHVNLFITS